MTLEDKLVQNWYDSRKAVLPAFLGYHLLDQNFPFPWAKNWKLGTEMGKIPKLHLLQLLMNN